MSEVITSKVVEEIANQKQANPTNLEISLNDHIDLEALEKLVSREGHLCTITFQIPGYSITVTSDGLVHVTADE